METSDILRKIGGHVVFAESQSGAFRTVIPQSILRITQFRNSANYKHPYGRIIRQNIWPKRPKLDGHQNKMAGVHVPR